MSSYLYSNKHLYLAAKAVSVIIDVGSVHSNNHSPPKARCSETDRKNDIVERPFSTLTSYKSKAPSDVYSPRQGHQKIQALNDWRDNGDAECCPDSRLYGCNTYQLQ
ncbi:hypothetical protein GQX74_000194 [Glossina fuscipes]|nr:hypothetical protein GQX74_000194 [Glossina fuscipes]